MPLFGEARRQYNRMWMAARRAAWFADKFCVKCGSKEKLENHHIDPSTKVSHCVWSWSQNRRDAELAKCEVLCESCHQSKTNIQLKEQFSTPLSGKKHGTNNTYNRHKCRCGLCKGWRILKHKRLGT